MKKELFADGAVLETTINAEKFDHLSAGALDTSTAAEPYVMLLTESRSPTVNLSPGKEDPDNGL